jgi:hypothetical protein
MYRENSLLNTHMSGAVSKLCTYLIFPGYPGVAISIIEFTKDKDTTNIELKEDTLKHILKHPEVKDRNVSVVSIVGSFRKGKSFLLNWLLRYMYSHVIEFSKFEIFRVN